MYFNKIMLDVVQLMPDSLNRAERNSALNTACRNMNNALVALEMSKHNTNYEQAKHNMCVLVHHAMIYLHTVDALATDVSQFEYEDALFTMPNANFQALPVAAWKAHIPQWGDSTVDTHLPSLIFSVLAWCSVNNWGFNAMWQKYRRALFENAHLLVKAMRDEQPCDCQPVVVNPSQLELPLDDARI